ncbi:MAG: 2-oxoglutarate ferredoxin oxidoreductase subunit beta [Ignavibacteria bacterium]|nr:2-oxoglutarate ferredoxin oxidoreductase subunit beta [Ignavibacteria bacterium]
MSGAPVEHGYTHEQICIPENLIYQRPGTLLEQEFHYCPGCGHSTAHKIFMEVVEEMGLEGEVIGVAPVGCSVFAYHYLNVDMQQAAHGRACAVATGIKRMLPDKIVFTYQGDGDLAAIGTAETIHAANRGENFLAIFINNGIYGMTSGQMAPTTLPGMVTTTSPFGRDTKTQGHPLKIGELLALLPGVAYVTRQAVDIPKNIRKAKKALQKALEYQKKGLGFCLVEIVSNCPSNWKMTPLESNKFVEEKMIPFYPLGDIKVPQEEKK